MEECFRCGISEDKAELYKGIYGNGIVNVCRKCYPKYRMPLIEKKQVNWEEVYKRNSVSKKDSGAIQKQFPLAKEKNDNPENVDLQKIIKANFDKMHIEKDKKPDDLIDNFNWVIMRKRRMMKITQKELAEKIMEPELIINSLEQGVLPQDYHQLIRKVENLLEIRLLKNVAVEIKPEDIVTEAKVPTGVLISDIKRIVPRFNFFSRKKTEISPEELNLKKVEEIVGKPVENVPIEKKLRPRKEISQEEVKKSVEKIKELISDSDSDIKKPDSSIESKRESNNGPVENSIKKPDKNIELTQEEINEIVWGKKN